MQGVSRVLEFMTHPRSVGFRTLAATSDGTEPMRCSSPYLLRRRALEAKRILRAVWFIAILIVIVGSVLPGNSAPLRFIDRLHISDKIEHLLAYAVLTFLPTIHERRRFGFAAATGAVALGVGLEFAQLYSGWRDFEVRDMLADAIGVVSGAAAAIPLRSVEIVRPLLVSADR